MASGPLGILTQKIGPAPAWLWAAGAGAAVWFLFLRGKGSSGAASKTSSAAGTSPTGQATTDYSLGYAQGLQSAAPGLQQGQGAQQAASGPTITVSNPSGASVPIWAYDVQHQGVIGQVPNGTTLPLIGPAVGFVGDPGYLVKWSGGTGFVQGAYVQAVQGQPGGVGGPRNLSTRKHGVGSRSAHEWHDAHPAVGARVLYPHYVRAVGGPANHVREIHRVARQAGVHPARVLMLNPTHTGRIRVA